jgi:hypothetical protein
MLDDFVTTSVFPDLIKVRNGYGHNSSKAFDRYLKGLFIKANGKSFHNFLYTFIDDHKQANAHPVRLKEIVGHQIDDETYGRYGKNCKLSTLKQFINEYEPLPKSALNRLSKFKLWKESESRSFRYIAHFFDTNTKSIFVNKNIVETLK